MSTSLIKKIWPKYTLNGFYSLIKSWPEVYMACDCCRDGKARVYRIIKKEDDLIKLESERIIRVGYCVAGIYNVENNTRMKLKISNKPFNYADTPNQNN